MVKHNATLPLTSTVLRFLIGANWLYGLCILSFLVLSFVREAWLFKAFGVPLSPEVMPLVGGMRAIMVLGIVSVPVHLAILKNLLSIVETVQSGDPFVSVNAMRLTTIAWMLFSLQVLSLMVAGIGRFVSTPAHPLHLNAGFSPSGWLAVLLTFVVARVFAVGTSLRDDLEGTV